VTPNGKRELEILKLTTIHDEAAQQKADQDKAEDGAAPAKQ
jgi:transcription elongation factor GreA